MVDQTRVLRLLRSVTDDLAVLREADEADDLRRADPLFLRGVKYTFITAIEACVDVAQHVCAAQGWGPPADNGDALAILGRHGVLDPALAGRMRQASGFRHVPVHEYVQVDDQIVWERLHEPGDLDRFTRAVGDWLTTVSR